MTTKRIAGGMAAAAAIGAAAAGLTAIASAGPAAYQVRPVDFGVSLPASGWYSQPQSPVPSPSPAVPTADQLTGLLNSLADPNVPFADKGNLVEGGIGKVEAHIAERKLSKAAQNGDLPLSFSVANIQPAADGSATADVSVSGPKLPTVTQSVTFVNQGSWVLSQSSAMELLQAAE